MKYDSSIDSSMTQYHDAILAAVRRMCSDNKEITEKFSPNDGSPAPLRDYLKKKHGKSYNGFGSSELFVNCHPTKGITINSDNIAENLGSKLELSWSQTTKFIYDNWDKIFEKSKPKNRALETLVKTFDEAEITCPNWIPGETLKYLEMVNGIHFKCKECESDFCKLDNITNFFARHCNNPEKCPYNKRDTEESLANNTAPEPQKDKPAETGKPKPTYKDVFLEHYPNFDVSRFEEFSKSVCVACCFMDDDSKCTFDDVCEKHWESGCLFKWRDELYNLDSEDIEVYLNSANGNTETADLPSPSLDQTTETATESSVITARAETVVNTFNYAVLTAEMGDFLKRKEQQLKNEYIIFISKWGEIFAEAQENLAKHGFGENNGIFNKWFDSLNLPISRRTMYRMISVYKFRSCQIGTNEEIQKIFDGLPKTTQYEIANGDVPAELVEALKSGDITTNEQYIALKKELDEASERVRTAEMQSRTYKQNYLQMEKNFDEMSNENIKLEKQNKELESRPHDTYYDVEEVNRRVEKAASKLQNQTAQQIAEERKTYGEKIDRMQSTIDELESQLSETKTYSNTKLFALRISPDDLAELQKIVSSCKNAAIKNAVSNVQIIKID